MLTSSLLGPSTVLQDVANGAALPEGACGADAIRLLRQALVAVGFAFPESDFFDAFDASMEAGVRVFRSSRGITESRLLLDSAAVARLDYEISFMEGIIPPQMKAGLLTDDQLMRLDPLMASFMGTRLGINQFDKRIIDRLRKKMELGDRMCFRLTTDLLPVVAKEFSKRVAEPRIFADYCSKVGPCTSAVFFDKTESLIPYRTFLISHNPGKADYCLSIGGLTRPDIVSHRPPDFDWYEVKPSSMYGLEDSVKKLVVLLGLYLKLPYRPGRRYKPTRDIVLANFVTPTGHPLKVVLEVELVMRGIIMWSFCVEGDYVEYFNRYQIVKGLLQILVALTIVLPEIIAGGEAGAGILAAIRGFAIANGITLESVLRVAR